MTDTRKREILQGGGGGEGTGTVDTTAPPSSNGSSSSSGHATGECSAAAAAADSLTNKRIKKAWLNFTGKRHTRVGSDYQVAVLPSCRSADSNEAEDAVARVSGENSPVSSS
jgi:hypothetical protein